MKRSVCLLLCLLLLLAGVGIFSYPMVSNYFAELNHTEVIVSYQQQVDAMEQEQIAQAWEQAREYHRRAARLKPQDPAVLHNEAYFQKEK